MLLVDLAVTLTVVIVCSAVVFAIAGWDGYGAGGWPTAIVVFGTFFLVVWAGGVWLTPLGPDLFGGAAAWIPFSIVGFIGALFVLAVSPFRRPRTAIAFHEQVQAKEVAHHGNRHCRRDSTCSRSQSVPALHSADTAAELAIDHGDPRKVHNWFG